MASGPITSWEINGETVETVSDFIFLGSKITADGDCSQEIKIRCLEEKLWQTQTVYPKAETSFVNKVHLVKAMVFSSSHVWLWELDHKEGWVPRNWCFQTVVLEKTLESLLDGKDIKPVNPKGNQPWILKGLMLKLKLQYFGHLKRRAYSLIKTLMLGKI